MVSRSDHTGALHLRIVDGAFWPLCGQFANRLSIQHARSGLLLLVCSLRLVENQLAVAYAAFYSYSGYDHDTLLRHYGSALFAVPHAWLDQHLPAIDRTTLFGRTLLHLPATPVFYDHSQ